MFLFEIFTSLFSYLILMVMVLVGVAFFTLLERKVLGYIQIRKGPNKVGYVGLLQPFSDSVKLFSKEMTYPYLSNYLVYYLSPIYSLFLVLLCWMLMPYWWGLFNFKLGVIFFMVCISMGVYLIMLAGWSSNSSYALLGGMRAVAQSISYEISLGFIMFSILIFVQGYDLMDFLKTQHYVWFIVIGWPMGFMWCVTLLAETNRTPFDLAEGESELVSGFNVEYSSGGFALIFLSEYSSIIFMSFLISLFFFGGGVCNYYFYFKIIFLGYCFIWIRGVLPRYRYDLLMELCWSFFLPFCLSMLGVCTLLILFMETMEF